MAHGKSGMAQGAGPSTRALALAACVVALGLLAWCGGEVLTRAPATAGPLSQSEASLLSVAEAVAGQGHVRVSVSRQAGKGRQVLVMVDQSAAVDDAILSQLVTSAAGLSAEAGDRVQLQRVPFAPGISGAPSPRDWAELSLLALLAGLAGWIGVKSPSRQTTVPVELVRETLPARMTPQPAAFQTTHADAPNDKAADLARQDPSRAADVLRGWMNRGGAA